MAKHSSLVVILALVAGFGLGVMFGPRIQLELASRGLLPGGPKPDPFAEVKETLRRAETVQAEIHADEARKAELCKQYPSISGC